MPLRKIIIIIFSITLSISAQSEKPNFIIFIADDVSWDDFGCYGNEDVQTPEIDKLASNGIIFNNVYLTASSCSPSRNSIMTGRYPHNTGAAELHTSPPIEMKSFPELLKHAGYYSAQGGKFHMGEYAKRGFDTMYTKGEDVGDGGEESWVKTIKERPKDKHFFMWFAAYDAHRDWGLNQFSNTHKYDSLNVPYYFADTKETRIDLCKYYDEIKRFDYYIGEVVKELNVQNILNNTFIIIMADNGRPFPHSKTRVNDRGMKTPFIISWPSTIKNSSQCSSLISAIDIAPTILELAGVELIESIQGVSFAKLIIDPDQDFRNFIFAEHNWHDYEAHERMVRNNNFMYILNSRPNKPQMGPADAVGSPTMVGLLELYDIGQLSAIQADIFVTPRPYEELYDLDKDPEQLLNVASVGDYNTTLKDMRCILKNWMVETGDNIPEELTKDWYEHKPGYLKTDEHSKRGIMPGNKFDATSNNNKGVF